VEAALTQLEEGRRLNGRRSRQQIVEQKLSDEQQRVAITGESGSETSVGNEFSIVFREVPSPDLPPKPAL